MKFMENIKVRKMQLGLFLLFLLLNITINAQSVKVVIKNEKKAPLFAASVQLIRLSDSTKYNAITNELGVVIFDKIENGLYVVNARFMGFQPLNKTISIKPEKRTFEFSLVQTEKSLDEFTITAPKPLITQEDDKMIIDPEPVANTSTNTLEVLENTPGMYVDQEGGIFLNGSSAAVIYINGREQKMSNQDIATLLRSLPPGSVQRIEVLRTPSTKYDASSSGGIINVILKKGVKIGQFSSVNMGMNQGVYGNRFVGYSLNNSGSNSTSYLNVNFNYSDMQELTNSTRTLSIDTLLKQNSTTRNNGYQGFLGYGINYDLSEKINFSYDGRINLNFPTSDAKTTNLIEQSLVPFAESDNLIFSDNQSVNLQQDFGIVRKIDTIGSNWDTKLSYNFNGTVANQNYTIDYRKPAIISFSGDGVNNQQRHLLLFQSDLTKQFKHKFKVETGVKSTFQTYQSEADYYIFYNNNRVTDSARINGFNYTESINAAYLQGSKTLFWEILLKVGARLEHTYMNGNQTIPSDTSFTINRIDWFPYVYLSRPIFKIADFEVRSFLIYRRTINRPNYQNLNPYKKYIDQFQFETGNPSLLPQFTDNIELNVSVDDHPLFAIGRNYTKDIFSGVVYPDQSNSSISVRTFDNIGTNVETYFRAIAGIPPGKIYFFMAGAQYNINEYDGMYDNQPLKYTRGSWRFFTFHSLTLFKQTKITMNSFMMTNGNFGMYELGTFGALNFGINQTLFNKKMTISLSFRDVLKTMKTAFTMNQGTIYTTGDRYSDNQRIGINIRYNFGIRKKDEKKNMMNMEEEL